MIILPILPQNTQESLTTPRRKSNLPPKPSSPLPSKVKIYNAAKAVIGFNARSTQNAAAATAAKYLAATNLLCFSERGQARLSLLFLPWRRKATEIGRGGKGSGRSSGNDDQGRHVEEYR